MENSSYKHENTCERLRRNFESDVLPKITNVYHVVSSFYAIRLRGEDDNRSVVGIFGTKSHIGYKNVIDSNLNFIHFCINETKKINDSLFIHEQEQIILVQGRNRQMKEKWIYVRNVAKKYQLDFTFIKKLFDLKNIKEQIKKLDSYNKELLFLLLLHIDESNIIPYQYFGAISYSDTYKLRENYLAMIDQFLLDGVQLLHAVCNWDDWKQIVEQHTTRILYGHLMYTPKNGLGYGIINVKSGISEDTIWMVKVTYWLIEAFKNQEPEKYFQLPNDKCIDMIKKDIFFDIFTALQPFFASKSEMVLHKFLVLKLDFQMYYIHVKKDYFLTREKFDQMFIITEVEQKLELKPWYKNGQLELFKFVDTNYRLGLDKAVYEYPFVDMPQFFQLDTAISKKDVQKFTEDFFSQQKFTPEQVAETLKRIMKHFFKNGENFELSVYRQILDDWSMNDMYILRDIKQKLQKITDDIRIEKTYRKVYYNERIIFYYDNSNRFTILDESNIPHDDDQFIPEVITKTRSSSYYFWDKRKDVFITKEMYKKTVHLVNKILAIISVNTISLQQLLEDIIKISFDDDTQIINFSDIVYKNDLASIVIDILYQTIPLFYTNMDIKSFFNLPYDILNFVKTATREKKTIFNIMRNICLKKTPIIRNLDELYESFTLFQVKDLSQAIDYIENNKDLAVVTDGIESPLLNKNIALFLVPSSIKQYLSDIDDFNEDEELTCFYKYQLSSLKVNDGLQIATKMYHYALLKNSFFVQKYNICTKEFLRVLVKWCVKKMESKHIEHYEMFICNLLIFILSFIDVFELHDAFVPYFTTDFVQLRNNDVLHHFGKMVIWDFINYKSIQRQDVFEEKILTADNKLLYYDNVICGIYVKGLTFDIMNTPLRTIFDFLLFLHLPIEKMLFFEKMTKFGQL